MTNFIQNVLQISITMAAVIGVLLLLYLCGKSVTVPSGARQFG